MKPDAPTFYEQVSEAVDAGDRQRVSNLYREQMARNAGVSSYQANFSAVMLEVSENAAKKDPRKFQHDMLAEILAVQSMLLHRVSEHIRTAIARHDKEYSGFHPWGNLPADVTDELLPRYARITTEIFNTMKMIKKLASPPVPAGTTANVQADGEDGDVQADVASDDA